jgi:hypothetical protein
MTPNNRLNSFSDPSNPFMSITDGLLYVDYVRPEVYFMMVEIFRGYAKGFNY